jgi:hypothetical protein
MPEQPNLTVERDEHVVALRLALTDLPDRYRNAIILHHLAGLDFEGVASELKCPIGTAKTHVRRGLEQLRSRLIKVGVSMSLVALIGTLQQLPAVPISAVSAHLMLLQASVKPSLSFTSLAGGVSMAGKVALAVAAAAVITAAPLIVSATSRAPGEPVAALDSGIGLSGNAAEKQRSTQIFFQDFAMLPLDEVTPNEFVRLREDNGDITAIVSQPYTADKSATWRPDVHIDYYVDRDPGDPKALFLVPDDMEVRIRIRAEQPGKWNPTLVPTLPQSDEDNFFANTVEIGVQWREFVFRTEDLKCYLSAEAGGRDLAPGVGIRRIGIYGYGTGRIFIDRFEVGSSGRDGD